MSPATHIIKEKLNPIPGSNEMRTKIWGVKCVTGLRYKQIGMKKYCITQAVLEPNPFMIDEGNFVSVMVVHNNDEEHLMAVLRHGQIYQVNLNMLFDRDKDVAFYLVGRGTVYLLGYEVILSKKNRGKVSSLKGVKESSPKVKEEEDDDAEDDDLHLKESDSSSSDTPPQKHSKSVKSKKKKKKSVQQVASEKISAVEMAGDDDDDDDEEDSDFCVGDDEFESSESDICDASEEEVEVDESEIQDLIAEKEDPELKPASKKRKQATESQHTLKRSKMDKSKKSLSPKKTQIENNDEEDSSKEDSSKEESSSKEDGTSQEDSIKEFSESDAASSCNGISKTASKLENETSAVKKKKKKKKAQETLMETPEETCKVLQKKSSSNKTMDLKKLKAGLEVQDLKIGHGPTVSYGKMVHIFYVARLPNKAIFDSRLPTKKPFSFKMGANQVIKGLEIGVEGMKAGGKRRIKVPPNMGYGIKGHGTVPPNSTLSFIVDLQAVS